MRARSHHSSTASGTKDDSVRASHQKWEILQPSESKGSDSLHKVLLDAVTKYKDNNGKYNGLIRLMSPQLLTTCYYLIKSNPGNMSAGVTPETLDGINEKWFNKTALEMLEGRFKFTPAKALQIPKSNKPGQYRQLLIASPREKIVQKAIQMILSAIFEPVFSDSSHGFRIGRSVTTALYQIHMRGGQMSLVINGDITKCFDRISHDVIMNEVRKKVDCARTLSLIERSLVAGYNDDKGSHVKSNIGTPQGSILSPLLCNIVLNKLDQFMIDNCSVLKIGNKRMLNPKYVALENKRKYYKLRDPAIAWKALLNMRKLSKFDTFDNSFRRALYVRYADVFIVLMASTLNEASKLKQRIADFLKQECGLELNQDKTTIDNTRKGFIFLGAKIRRGTNVSIFNSYLKSRKKVSRRTTLGVDAPIKLLLEKLTVNGFARRNNQGTFLAKGKTKMIHLSHFYIIRYYNSKITGLLNAFSFAGNFSVMSRVIWVLRQSCALTLARKFKLKTINKAFGKFSFDLTDPDTGVKLNIPESFKANYDYKLNPALFGRNLEETADKILSQPWSLSLTNKLPEVCVLCGSYTNVHKHHLKKVADVRQKIRTGNISWKQWLGGVKGKQVPLCKYHHEMLHKGALNAADQRIIANYTGRAPRH